MPTNIDTLIKTKTIHQLEMMLYTDDDTEKATVRAALITQLLRSLQEATHPNNQITVELLCTQRERIRGIVKQAIDILTDALIDY